MTEIAFCFCPVYTFFFTSKCLYQHIAYHYVLGTVKHTHHAEQNFRSTKNYKITDWHDRLYSEINLSGVNPKLPVDFAGTFPIHLFYMVITR